MLGIGGSLEHGAAVNSEDARRLLERVVHQRAYLGTLERALAESRDGCLLLGAPLELCLGELAVGDVRDHAVPHGVSASVADERGFVAYPHDASVAVDHSIFLGNRSAPQLVLAAEHALAIVGVDLARPQAGIGHPLLGREAEHLERSRAHVVPAPADADIGHVHDRRQAVEQRPRALLAGQPARVIWIPAPIVPASWLGRGHPSFVIGTGEPKLRSPDVLWPPLERLFGSPVRPRDSRSAASAAPMLARQRSCPSSSSVSEECASSAGSIGARKLISR